MKLSLISLNILIFALQLSCSNPGVGGNSPLKNPDYEQENPPIDDNGSDGVPNKPNLKHGLRLGATVRSKVGCNLYKELDAGLWSGEYSFDGNLSDWKDIAKTFSSKYNVKHLISDETLYISMHLDSDAAIQSLNVNLGRVGFSSENEVEVETIVELKANTTSKDLLYIQKGNSLEIKVSKEAFARVGHSSVWFAGLELEQSGQSIRFNPFFRPTMKFNKNNDFSVHRCHMENSKSKIDFDLIYDSNVDRQVLEPVFQNIIGLSFNDYISKFVGNFQDQQGSFTSLIGSENIIINNSNVSLLKLIYQNTN